MFWIGTCQIIFKLQNERQKWLEKITEIITKRKRNAERELRSRTIMGLITVPEVSKQNARFTLYSEALKQFYKFKY